MSKKNVIVFDLDGTLAESKAAITDDMSDLIGKLLQERVVCVISGGRYEQFEAQLISNLKVDESVLGSLHLMPTCGTRYYSYHPEEHFWEMQYSNDFTEEEKQEIIRALEESAKELGLVEDDPWGNIIEDRGSQITYSALGQKAPVKAKKKWDPKDDKKMSMRDATQKRIPNFDVHMGGTTSVDVTHKGIDKAYGVGRLVEALGAKKEDVLFMGDRMFEGGNDYPVKAAGYDSIYVKDPEATAKEIKKLI